MAGYAPWEQQFFGIGGVNPRAGTTPVAPATVPPVNTGGYTPPAGTSSTAVAPSGGGGGPTSVDASFSASDLMGLISQEPGYQAFEAAKGLGLGNAAAQRKQALRDLVVHFGGIANMNDVYGDVDQSTKDLASANQFSDTQQLQRKYETGVESFKRALAGRGALQSGDLQYGLDQADLQKGQSQYDLSNQFLSASQKAVNDYVQAQAAWQQQEADAIWKAAQAVGGWYRPSGGGGYDTPTEAPSVYQPPTVVSGFSQPLTGYQNDPLGLGYGRPGGW